MIRIVSFPLAPSTNECFLHLRHNPGLPVPSATYKAFKKACHLWRDGRPSVVESIALELVEWLKGGLMIRVDAYFVFSRARLWTLNGSPRKLDANNRLKPALDGLVSCLGIDDAYFWGGHCEKIQCNSVDQERSVFVLSPCRPKNLDELFSDLSLDSSENYSSPILVEKPKKKPKTKSPGRSKRSKFLLHC